MLKTSKTNGSYTKQINKLEKQKLLILDDFGLKPLEIINRHALMEIIQDHYGQKSIIIASQLPVVKWHDIIGEKTLADTILDSLAHLEHRIDLYGESLRGKLKTKTKFNRQID